MGGSIHPIDIYKEARTLRRMDESLRVFKPFMVAKGGDPKSDVKFTERYVMLLNGTRIIPYNITHVLTVTGVVITDDSQEGIACFDRTPLSPTVRVDINYVPPQVEIITVSTGGALLSDERAKLLGLPSAVVNAEAVWEYEGRSLDDVSNINSYISQIPSEVRSELSTELMDIVFIMKIMKNKREIKKIGSTWTAIVYDDDGITEILSKALKDKTNQEITDLTAGALAKELATSV